MELKCRLEGIEYRSRKAGISTLTVRILETKEILTATGPIDDPVITGIYILNGDYNEDRLFLFHSYRRSVDGRQDSIDTLRFSVPGITSELAGKIVDAIGDDIFDIPASTNIIKKLILIKGIGDKKARDIDRFLKGSSSASSTLKLLTENGINACDCLKFLSDKGPSSYRMLISNPYTLTAYGVSFNECDRLAESLGIDAWDKRRILASFNDVSARAASHGSTRTDITSFKRNIAKVTGSPKRLNIPDELTDIFLPGSSIETYEDNGTIYAEKAELLMAEKSIAANLKRLCTYARPLAADTSGLVTLVEEKMDLTFSDEQKAVFNTLATGGVSILTGGPGCGKTTVLSGVVMAFKILFPDLNPLLIAPTGRASARMNEMSGSSAKTIHKALGLKYFDIGSNTCDKLLYDLIIVDEMSMTDTELFAKLLESISSGTTLILVGDSNQLPSVGPGKVFKDICECGLFTRYALSHSKRQDEGSTIVKNAENILKGSALTVDGSFTIETVPSEEDILERISRIPINDHIQILSPTKKTGAGCDAINRMVQSSLRHSGKSIWLNHTRFYIGDRVIMTENRYDIGFMNGDVGQIEALSESDITIHFSDKALTIDISDLTGMQLAYALTVHKSQGAECETVYLILPEGSACMAKRELLYTAITRAKKSVHIIEQPGLIRKYLTDERREERDCGLLSILKQQIAC